MRRVLVITNNLQQAAFRLRIGAIVGPLRARGFKLDVQVRPKGVLARRKLLKTAAKYDAVILQRKLLDPADARLLRTYGRRIFYDIDDAVMEHQRPVGAMTRWRTRRRFEATAGIVHHVVAGNDHLAGRFAGLGCPVTVVPTGVEPSHYPVRRHRPDDRPVLVWIGSKSTLGYVRERLRALELAGGRVRDLSLRIIADESLDPAGIPVEFVRWSEAGEGAALAGGMIGIAPTPEDRWTLGKCGFKIVQYMAAGLPVVASGVGANAAIVDEGVTGFLADDDAAWAEAIARLAGDAQLRSAMGAAGRAKVEREYSLDRIVAVWAGLLGEC